MRVAIIGSRCFPETYGREVISKLFASFGPKVEIVSGGAKGPDTWAEEAAFLHGLPVRVIRPDWERHGKGAGFIRNKEIVDCCDMVVALWDGESKGTANSLEHAERARKPILVVTPH